VHPSGGSASVFGLDTVNNSIEIRRRVGYLAQNASYYKNMSARENLRYRARFYYSGPKDAIEKKVAENLELVDLQDKADRPIKGFSGGERQRLGIAQALINSPDLLILDEPAASLDPMGRRDVLDIMQRLKGKTTVFYSTHILDDVQRVSDTVAILNHGSVVASGPIGELLAGSGDTAYSLTLRGDTSEARARVSSQPWVKAIKAEQSADGETWIVSVTEEEAAETQLLRLLLSDDGKVRISEFRRVTHNLEDIFMHIIEGSNNG